MHSSWRLFIIIELLLALWAIQQMLHNPPILVFFILACLNLGYAIKRKRPSSFNRFQKIASGVVMILCLLYIVPVWIMLIIAILFIGLKGIEVSGVALFSGAPWNKKQMVMVQTVDAEAKSGRRFKRHWFGNTRIGSHTYEWDDINFSLLAGDTIIDLGNTLLPREDNVIVIRKGLGRTRILVPTGVGVMVEHSSLFGDLSFQKKTYHLRNESVKLYSNDYDETARRLKIITNTLFGDIEVITL